MAYGLKYITVFDGGPQGAEPYTLEFHFKDWVGSFTNFLASGDPVTHVWDKDEPKPGIKGSSLNISAINTGLIPLSSFFSVVDDNCKVIYKWGTQVLFEGFLVQDDCTEVMVDYNHIINFTATDNLGLLKDIPFDKANLIVGDGNRVITGVQAYWVDSMIAQPYLFLNTLTSGAVIGDTIIIEGTGTSDGIYTITNIISFMPGAPAVAIYLDREVPYDIPDSTGYTFTFITPADLNDRLSLAYIIRICLYSTTLELNCDVYSNIIETVTTTNRFLEETFEYGYDFSNGSNNFKSCYDVLNIILERFNATLFQSEGVWNIIRRDEHRYYDNAITGFRYDSEMVYVSDILFDDIFQSSPNIDPSIAAPDTYPITGITKSILRPYNFSKETYNYRQPDNLLKNSDLQTLGILDSTVVVGAETWYNYFMPFWYDHIFVPPIIPNANQQHRIRVVIDTATGNEIERYALTYDSNATYLDEESVESTKIELSKGDIFKYSFTFKKQNFYDNPNAYFIIKFVNSTTTYYLQCLSGLTGIWSTIGGNCVYGLPSGSTLSEWTNVDFTCLPVPTSGTLYVYFTRMLFPGESIGYATYYKNLELSIRQNINYSTLITGQTHTDIQQQLIKNNEDVEIFIDDSPRNSIQGTLFLSTFENLVQDRTSLWGYAPGGDRRLGEITTFEQLFWRRVPRTKLEGTMYGIVQPVQRTFKTSANFFVITGVPPDVYTIDLPGVPEDYLVAGTVITITGSASNDGTYTIGGNILHTSFYVIEPIVDEIVDEITVTMTVPRHISMLTLLKYSGLSGLNFIFGTLSIDYKNNNFTGTMWEQWEDGEVDADLTSDYNFKYLYQTI